MTAHHEFLATADAFGSLYPFEESVFSRVQPKTELAQMGGGKETDIRFEQIGSQPPLLGIGVRSGLEAKGKECEGTGLTKAGSGNDPVGRTNTEEISKVRALKTKAEDVLPKPKRGQKRVMSDPSPVVQEVQPPPCFFSPTQTEHVKAWAPATYGEPRLFALMVQLAKSVIEGRGDQETVETLLAKSTSRDQDLADKAGHNVKLGLELGLLKQQGADQGCLSLTEEGRRCVIQGIRVRLGMLKVSRLSAEQICASLCSDEIEDWQIEARDRAKALQQCFEPARGLRGKLAANEASEHGLVSSELHEISAQIGNKVSRSALGHALQAKAVLVAKNNSQFGPLWSGLVR